MEKQMDSMKQHHNAERVEEALKNVRILAGRPKLTAPSILLARLEVLVECALKTGHSDTEYFSKALQTCRQFEDNPDVCNLCLKLLGSSEDKTISATIAEWAKCKKYDSKFEVGSKEAKGYPQQNVLPEQRSVPFYYPPFYPPIPFGQGYQGPGFPSFMGPRRPGFRHRFQRDRGACFFFCKETTHFISNCPKMKRE